MKKYKVIIDHRLIWSILQQPLIATLIGFLITVAIDFDPEWKWVAYATGFSIWTYILCFKGTANMWFIYPEANKIVVLAHPFKTQIVPSGDELASIQDTRSMRGIVGPALAGKSIFESVVCIIDTLRSESLAEEPVVAYTKNNIKVTVRFQAFMTAIASAEAAVNLARYNVAYIKERFMNSFRSYIISTIVTMTDVDLLSAIYDDPKDETRKITGVDRLRHGFNNLYGGAGKIDETELRHGIFTGDPVIGDVIIDPDYQRAKQAVSAAEQTAKAISKFEGTGVSPDIAANMVAASNGQPPPAQIKRYIGLDGTGHIVVGDVSS